MENSTPEIEVLVTPDCAHAAEALALVREVAREVAPGAEIVRVEVTTEDEAQARSFPGSPTIRIAGRDVAGESAARPGLT